MCVQGPDEIIVDMRKEFNLKVVAQTSDPNMSQEEFDQLVMEGILKAEIEANKSRVRFHFNPTATQSRFVTNPNLGT